MISQMNMYIKKYRIHFLCFVIFGLWVLLCFGFILCSYTDFCVLKNIESADTLSDYMPKNSCSLSKMEGINNIYTSNNLKVLVVPPKNHKANKKYAALIVFPPAGKTVRKSEIFYEGLTVEANKLGYILAYTDYLPLDERNLIKLADVKKALVDSYCINTKNINLLGHSDGATNAAMITYRDMGLEIKNLLISANGINKDTLNREICPKDRFSIFVFHSIKDQFFPNFGRDNVEWLANCSKCKNNLIELDNGCMKVQNCDRKIVYCEGIESHNVWPKRNDILINFLN